MASESKRRRGGKVGTTNLTPKTNPDMAADLQRAQEAVESGKRKSLLDAFKLEMRKSEMEIGDRNNPYLDRNDIQRLAERQAEFSFLPELGNSQADVSERQNRIAQDHEFVYGSALLRSVPDESGVATYEIPVTHTYWKGRTATNGGIGSKRKKEEKIVKVRVNILK